MKLQRFAGNFKPTFWSKYIQTELAKDLVIAKQFFERAAKQGHAKAAESLKLIGIGL